MIRIMIQRSQYDTYHNTEITIRYIIYKGHNMIHITIQRSQYDTYHDTEVTM